MNGSTDGEWCGEGILEIHTPSDHTYNGSHFDVEIEILHRAPDLALARVSMFFNRSAGNTSSPFFEALNIPHAPIIQA